MNLRESLLLSPVNNLNPEVFKKIFKDILPADREFFLKKILYDKYSPIFLNYVNNHKLQYLFNEKEITNIDLIKLQKMTLLYNALENGWSIKKADNCYVFKKKP